MVEVMLCKLINNLIKNVIVPLQGIDVDLDVDVDVLD